MKLATAATVAVLIASTYVTADVTTPKSPAQPLASTLKWNGFFGSEGPESETSYSLLRQGYMSLWGGGSLDHVALNAAIKSWIETHPDARVVPVDFTPFEKNFGETYAWLVAGAENLNVELVRKGLCQGYQMLVPEGTPDWRVARDEYDRFEAAIDHAELAAIAARAGVWAREDMQHKAHWQRAEDFERQRKFAEAIAEFKLTLTGDADNSQDGSSWLRLARCYDAAGDYPAALLAFDKSVPSGGEPHLAWNRLEKAQCVSKHEGPDKAAAMLERAIAAQPDDTVGYEILGVFEHGEKRFGRATKALERGTARFEKRANLRFDSNDAIIWEPQRVAENNSYFSDVHLLSFQYERLAQFHLDAGAPDQALRFCARVLSICRNGMSTPSGRYSPAQIEAGDSTCRIVRAQIFLNRGSLAAAKVELDHVKVLLGSKTGQGFGVGEAFEKLSDELARKMAAKPTS